MLGRVHHKGRLLLATPPLVDPHFDRTVVYLVEHTDDGAIGVVLNRAEDAELEPPLDRWNDLLAPPATLFAGGPVEVQGLLALARTSAPVDVDADELTPITESIASANLAADPALVAAQVDTVRVFRGYAGWSAGQLDAELESGAWLVLDSLDDDIFTAQPDELWRTVLGRQPGRLAWLANVPDDLSSN